ncbi:MAG: 7-cyano-7-deazaguanine synthase QueC [Planctomycetes bacterium]|nr:7-cyano-7-deazaguanine synthase QueC [Planctomycetota bacterium]
MDTEGVSTRNSRDSRGRGVVLLSGGVDSATTAAIAREHGFAIFALSFDYGQRHAVELGAAARVAAHLGVARHVLQRIDLRAFGGSALTDAIDVPKPGLVGERPPEIPITYVPARNTIFLAFALAYAESVGACDLFIGVSAVDYSGYPDCRPAFIDAFERLARLATRAGVEGADIRIHAPLIHLSKAETIREGLRLGVDYSLTHSCYDPTTAGAACGLCESCVLRKRGFAEAGVPDPTTYA